MGLRKTLRKTKVGFRDWLRVRYVLAPSQRPFENCTLIFNNTNNVCMFSYLCICTVKYVDLIDLNHVPRPGSIAAIIIFFHHRSCTSSNPHTHRQQSRLNESSCKSLKPDLQPTQPLCFTRPKPLPSYPMAFSDHPEPCPFILVFILFC